MANTTMMNNTNAIGQPTKKEQIRQDASMNPAGTCRPDSNTLKMMSKIMWLLFEYC